MPGIRPTSAERQDPLDHYRRGADPEVRRRPHVLRLLDAGHPWAAISAVPFRSASTTSRWERRSEADGADAVPGRPKGRRRSGAHVWAAPVVRWVRTLSPADLRFARSRRSRGAAAVVLREDFRATVGRETARRWLREADLVWRRPRPTIRPQGPGRGKERRALRARLEGLPGGETAASVDAVGGSLDPKVGCRWMRRGVQAAVETPGSNEKRYLAGGIHRRAGRVTLTEGKAEQGRGAALLVRHLGDLRRAFRQYTVTHVLCDDAGTHTAGGSELARAYPGKWERRVRPHYLPK